MATVASLAAELAAVKTDMATIGTNIDGFFLVINATIIYCKLPSLHPYSSVFRYKFIILLNCPHVSDLTCSVYLWALLGAWRSARRQVLPPDECSLIFSPVMQCGFAFLECGAVRAKNATNILLKNILDSCKCEYIFLEPFTLAWDVTNANRDVARIFRKGGRDPPTKLYFYWSIIILTGVSPPSPPPRYTPKELRHIPPLLLVKWDASLPGGLWVTYLNERGRHMSYTPCF